MARARHVTFRASHDYKASYAGIPCWPFIRDSGGFNRGVQTVREISRLKYQRFLVNVSSFFFCFSFFFFFLEREKKGKGVEEVRILPRSFFNDRV